MTIPQLLVPVSAGSIEVRPVHGEAEWRAIRRLRYECYVDELGYAPDGADHERREVGDSLDATATTLVAVRAGQVLASVRLEFDGVAESSYGRWLDARSWLERGGLRSVYAVGKLVVHHEHRGTRVTVGLLRAAYRMGLDVGCRFCLIACKAERVRLYERLGFKAYGDPVPSAQFGTAMRMVLEMRDLGHLERVGSPLAPELRTQTTSSPPGGRASSWPMVDMGNGVHSGASSGMAAVARVAS